MGNTYSSVWVYRYINWALPIDLVGGNQYTKDKDVDNKNKDLKNSKLIKALYHRAAREVIVSFTDTPNAKETQEIADKALKDVNTALLTSDLKNVLSVEPGSR
jgi:hypothetical protein